MNHVTFSDGRDLVPDGLVLAAEAALMAADEVSLSESERIVAGYGVSVAALRELGRVIINHSNMSKRIPRDVMDYAYRVFSAPL